jgi:RNA polymerase sigma factor for flagellar operon FliA
MDVAGLFSGSLPLIDSVARKVCARRGVMGADAEDFASSARLALLENDYAILRSFQGRSSLSGYLAVVFDRLLNDQRVHTLGKWHPSRAAEHIGPAAVMLEKLVVRDRRTIEEALPIVRGVDASLTRADLESMLSRFPDRIPRPRAVSLDDDTSPARIVAASDRADARALDNETRRLAGVAAETVRRTLARFSLEDRMLVRFHYGAMMSIADISRMMRLPQRPLYRRIEAVLRQLRAALESAGVDGRSAIELVGSVTAEMNFGLEIDDAMENVPNRPSQVVQMTATGEDSP